MEVIRFDGYTTSEKVAIARGYLWPRQLERNGLRPEEVEISDDLLKTIAVEYTRDPQSLCEALRILLEDELGSQMSSVAARLAPHMFFAAGGSAWTRLLQSHPPLTERIARLEQKEQGSAR